MEPLSPHCDPLAAAIHNIETRYKHTHPYEEMDDPLVKTVRKKRPEMMIEDLDKLEARADDHRYES